MNTQPLVLLAAPQEKNQSELQTQFVNALQHRIKSEGIRLEIDGRDYEGLASRYQLMRRCQGAVVVASAQWTARRLYRHKDQSLIVPSEFSHVATSMAVSTGRPLLVLREKDVAERGSLKQGYVDLTAVIPSKAGPKWLDSQTFTDIFAEWLKRVREQRQVFLAYSSGVSRLANEVHRYLTEHLNLSVLDWQEMSASQSVMDNIIKAERQTMFGVFLLTKDDKELDQGGVRRALPRDNVVFEAGYFAGAKGAQFDLIVHEAGAKLPSDLGGFVYLELKRGLGIASIETKIRKYFEQHFPK
jgi:hypothetical protein